MPGYTFRWPYMELIYQHKAKLTELIERLKDLLTFIMLAYYMLKYPLKCVTVSAHFCGDSTTNDDRAML